MKKIFKQAIWAIPIILLVASCFPEYDATIEEMDLAITRVSDDQDFTAYHTFYLYDTVMYVVEDEKDLEDLDRTHDAQIISEVRQHLLDLGWTEITDTTDLKDEADVSIMLSALAVDIYYYYTYWWDYWYWWDWYYWYPGWPIYPIYPSYPSYGYSVGTVMIDMLDLKNFETDQQDSETPKIDVIWSGAVNGILAGSDAAVSQRLTKQMDQVFTQSSYLQK